MIIIIIISQIRHYIIIVTVAEHRQTGSSLHNVLLIPFHIPFKCSFPRFWPVISCLGLFFSTCSTMIDHYKNNSLHNHRAK